MKKKQKKEKDKFTFRGKYPDDCFDPKKKTNYVRNIMTRYNKVGNRE